MNAINDVLNTNTALIISSIYHLPLPLQKNDIAILTVSSPLNWNSNVAPLCLPPAIDYTGRTAVVAGWGATSSGKLQPDT